VAVEDGERREDNSTQLGQMEEHCVPSPLPSLRLVNNIYKYFQNNKIPTNNKNGQNFKNKQNK
jgi:hypothetical protein